MGDPARIGLELFSRARWEAPEVAGYMPVLFGDKGMLESLIRDWKEAVAPG
jgi:hypothetical protein